MNTNWKKLAAMGCSVLYILLYLFLPVIAVKLLGVGASGMDLFSLSVWSYLPLVAGIAMAICAIVTSPKAGGAVCIVGAFIPLITYFIVNGEIVGGVASISGVSALSPLLGMGANVIFTVGAGVILPMLLGIGAAVLCFLSDMQPKATTRTAGLGSDEGDEW